MNQIKKNMITKEEIINNLIYPSLRDILESNNTIIDIKTDTELFGSGSSLDSIAVVNLILAIEEKISEMYELNINLANEKAMSSNHSPFKTVDSLAKYILELISQID